MYIWPPKNERYIQANNLRGVNVDVEIKDYRIITPKSNVKATFTQISSTIMNAITSVYGREFINRNSDIKVIIEVHAYHADFYTGMWHGQTRYVVRLNDTEETIEQDNYLYNTLGNSTGKSVLNKSFIGVNMKLFDFLNNHLR